MPVRLTQLSVTSADEVINQSENFVEPLLQSDTVLKKTRSTLHANCARNAQKTVHKITKVKKCIPAKMEHLKI